jgi:hypothetical protein
MKKQLVEIRHTPNIAWPAFVDEHGVRVLVAPTEIENDSKKTGDKKTFDDLPLPAIAIEMLKNKETIPAIYFHRDSTHIQFGWLAPWEAWNAGRVEDLTYGDCEDWLLSCCQEFATEKPLNLWEMIETSAQFCASPRGASLPAWMERRREQMMEAIEAVAATMQEAHEDAEDAAATFAPHIEGKEAQEKLQKILLENAQDNGHFAEA